VPVPAYVKPGDNGKAQVTEAHRFVLPEINIDIRELLPCYKLTWCAIDRLTRQFECPFALALTSQEVALYVE
jgi:hypothetical protein